ncbi:MAG: PucR family transcriptional regulator [Schwartzia succinivorans]|nr:PucR family transcriptional regulator [Schwartzia succinivorans]
MRKAWYWLLNSLLNVSKRKRFNSRYENGRLRNGTNNKKHEVYMLAYFEADGSLTKASEMLFIHKNTLQYKLHRIAQLTGYDIRKPREAAVFAMALMFFDETQRGKDVGIEK